MIFPIVALTIALIVSLLATPVAIRLAIRYGLVDHPDSHRKLHRKPIALCGGIAVLVSVIVTVALMLGVREDIFKASQTSINLAISLTLASVAIVVLGVLDDRFGLRGRQKLAGQIVICGFLVVSGFTIPDLSLFGWTFELGVLVPFITLGWLLLAVNSVNLIDGADGLCSSVGWVAATAVSAIGFITGNSVESMLAASMAGALLGFLIFNLPPARVFLGDAGSMFVGLFLGVLVMRVPVAGGTPLPILVPLGILAIPLFDSMMAIVRRKLTGRSVFTVDRGHLHHNLMRLGIRNQLLVAAITAMAVITSGGAFLSVRQQSDFYVVGAVLLATGLLVATRAFGFAEMELLCKRVLGFSKSLVRREGGQCGARIQKVRLQGSREWETVWCALVEFAEKNSLARISLDLNVPWLHEGFHASRDVFQMPELNERWHFKIPIESGGRILGRLEIVGRYEGTTTYDVLAYLSDMLQEIQPAIESLVSDMASAPTPTPASSPTPSLETAEQPLDVAPELVG